MAAIGYFPLSGTSILQQPKVIYQPKPTPTTTSGTPPVITSTRPPLPSSPPPPRLLPPTYIKPEPLVPTTQSPAGPTDTGSGGTGTGSTGSGGSGAGTGGTDTGTGTTDPQQRVFDFISSLLGPSDVGQTYGPQSVSSDAIGPASSGSSMPIILLVLLAIGGFAWYATHKKKAA